jgi:transcriptional regulator with XRE-family HTH domain
MPHPVDIHVGKQVRKLRLILGVTQVELAAQLDLSFQQVQKYETGANRLSASRMFEISEILGVETSAFFEGFCAASKEGTTKEISSKISEVIEEIKERLSVYR